MSLKFIKGRAGSGKSTYMINEMEAFNDSIYIVPEQFTFSAEKRIVERFGVSGLGNPQVLSFKRLADIIFARYGAPEFISGNAAYEMIVSYASNSLDANKLNLFGGLVKKSEFASTASTIITTFKKYGVTKDKLSFAIENTDDALLKKKLEDSLFVYSEYLEQLKEADISDIHDTLSILAKIIDGEDVDFFDGKNVYIDQFTDFDPCEQECIFQIVKKAQSVRVALCIDDDEFFSAVARTEKALKSLAERAGINIEPSEYLDGAMHGASPMLKHLERSYYSEFDAPFAGTDNSLSLFCAKNMNSEIHKVAREIVKLVRDNGYRYRDISVVARDAQAYKGIIERIFPIYNIPVFMDRKIQLSNHCITLFITSVLNIMMAGFTYENVFSYAKSPFSPLTKEETDDLENYCLACGTRPYAWKKPFFMRPDTYKGENDSKKETHDEERLIYLNSLREKIYNPISNLKNKLENVNQAENIVKALFEFFEESSLEKRVEEYSLALENNDENLCAMQTKQVYNILVDLFCDLCDVLGSKEMSLREFYITVQAGLKAVEIGTIPVSADCVTVGSIDRIKGHGAEAVFLVGVNNSVFPASYADDGLFTENDKEELKRLNIEMPPSTLEKTQSEQMLVYDALTCANKKLFISYPISSAHETSLMSSEIVNRIYKLFPDIEYTDDIFEKDNDIEDISSKRAAFEKLCAQIGRLQCEGKDISPLMKNAAYYFENDGEYSNLLSHSIKMAQFNNEAVTIDKEKIEKAIGENMKTSITRLENYNKCPFSYFAKYLLKLQPRKIFEVKVSDSGSFLHDFLDKFSQLLISATDENGNPYTWKTIDSHFIKKNTPLILAEILNNVNPSFLEIPRIKALFDRLCRVAQESVYAVKRHMESGNFVPMGYEISFDDNGTFKPMKITLPDGKKVTLRGRIDRADELKVTLSNGQEGTFARIVDYKSSDKQIVLSDVYYGAQLQLFVYLSNLCENGYKPAGILYCNLTDKIVNVNAYTSEEDILKLRNEERRMKGIVLSEEGMFEQMGGKTAIKNEKTINLRQFNSMFKHLNKVIKATAEKIYGGNFPISCTSDACKWCDYASFCRFDSSLHGCSINDKEALKDAEVWALIEEGNANEMD